MCVVSSGTPSTLRFESGLRTGQYVSVVPYETEPPCDGAFSAAMAQFDEHGYAGFQLSNASLTVRMRLVGEHRLCVATDASLGVWQPIVPEVRLMAA